MWRFWAVRKLLTHRVALGPGSSLAGACSAGTRDSRVPGECSERPYASGTRPGTQRENREAQYFLTQQRICDSPARKRGRVQIEFAARADSAPSEYPLSSFDHSICAGEQRRRQFETERLRRR